MKRFFDTVDEKWKSPIVDKIAARWFNGGIDARVLRASANFVVVIKAEDRKYFLRFNHSSERTTEFIKAEIKYLQYLRGKGVNVNKPLLSLAGRYVESVSTKLGILHVVLFEAVPGSHIKIDDLDLKGFEDWGKALGELHNASAGYKAGGIPSWRDQVAYTRKTLPESDTVVLKELSVVEEALEGLQADESNYGLIHYDFELDNIRWQDGVPGFMDFDDCVYHWYAADIIIAISELFDDKVNKVDVEDEQFQAFLRGYRSTRPVKDEDLANISYFLRLDKLYTYARVYRSIEDGPIEDEPQWTTNLRQKLGTHNRETVNEIKSS